MIVSLEAFRPPTAIPVKFVQVLPSSLHHWWRVVQPIGLAGSAET